LFDLVIRGATLVTPSGLLEADLGIAEGAIEAIGPDLDSGRTETDAVGLHIFPGTVDAHLHFNEPGRTDWEGAATGSQALAAGGGTTFIDMPLNSTPCTVNAFEFERKREALAAASIADFALWGGLIPGNPDELPGLAEAGAIGFKAFMSNSGLPEFPRADDLTLYEGMLEAARLGLPVAVHAESEEITSRLADRILLSGASGVRDFLASRPVIAEVEAITRAALLAQVTRASLHIVHISSGAGVAAALEARARGVNITIETCPHYLFFTTEDVERIGVAAKCAPPIRDSANQDLLWQSVLDGTLDLIGSDHSPAPLEEKSGDFFRAWGGIAGVQSTLPVLLEAGYHQRGLPLGRIAALLASRPAQRFGLARKGAIAVGFDADLAFVALNESFTLNHLYQRHPMSPYLGSQFRGAIRRTLRRGETLFDGSSITATTKGLFLPCTL
jgi:allantoinase